MIGAVATLVLKDHKLVVVAVLHACVVRDVLGPMVGNKFGVDDIDELDAVDVVAGAHGQAEIFNIHLSEGRGRKWRWFGIVVSVVFVLVRRVGNENALCVKAG